MLLITDISLIVVGIYAIIYILYGRSKRKPIFGRKKPGDPSYEVFLKVVDNKRYLTVTIIVTIVAMLSLLFDVFVILR